MTSGLAILAGHATAWAVVGGAIACVAILAAIMLIHDHQRMENYTLSLKKDMANLNERLFDLSEREERYRTLIEAQGDLIVRCNSSQRVTYVNESFVKMFASSTLQSARDAFLDQPLKLNVVETKSDITRPDGARLFDECYELLDGQHWISWVETTVTSSHGEKEYVRVGRDMTAQTHTVKALHDARTKAETASESKSRFLATVSHEVRTPLNGILGMAELLKDTTLSLEQRTYVDAMQTSGEALLSLIDEILDFSRIESGRLDIIESAFDLPPLIESVVELLAPRAQGKGIEIAASIAPEVPTRVIGDQDRLRQVLMNLAGNAVKFTNSGGVGVMVSLSHDGMVTFEVADTGPGIPENRLDNIFEEFERVDGSPASQHEGTGLGLAISKRIITHMQGTVHVESDLGHGASFVVQLPLKACNVTQDAPKVLHAYPKLDKMKALIISRSPFEAPFLAQRLKEAGAKVDRVMTLPQALRKLTQGAYKLVIADCALGEAATRKIAQTAKDQGARRTLVLLSPFERRDFGSPTAAGFDGYLVKPVRTRSLFERLHAELDATATTAVVETVSASMPQVSRRVLIAEDNEINALLITKMLEKMGAQADWVTNGRRAVDRMLAAMAGKLPMYDLAILDIRMPGLDGLQVARLIRTAEAERGMPSLTLIALTANVMPEDRNAALNAGFTAFLPKPLSYEHLKDIVRQVPVSNGHEQEQVPLIA